MTARRAKRLRGGLPISRGQHDPGRWPSYDTTRAPPLSPASAEIGSVHTWQPELTNLPRSHNDVGRGIAFHQGGKLAGGPGIAQHPQLCGYTVWVIEADVGDGAVDQDG
jgi:hypothetical protein